MARKSSMWLTEQKSAQKALKMHICITVMQWQSFGRFSPRETLATLSAAAPTTHVT
jgi:hypothetical protein